MHFASGIRDFERNQVRFKDLLNLPFSISFAIVHRHRIASGESNIYPLSLGVNIQLDAGQNRIDLTTFTNLSCASTKGDMQRSFFLLLLRSLITLHTNTQAYSCTQRVPYSRSHSSSTQKLRTHWLFFGLSFDTSAATTTTTTTVRSSTIFSFFCTCYIQPFERCTNDVYRKRDL